jgi:hypothetical protein
VRPRTPGRLQPDACTAADHHYDLPGQFRFTPLRNRSGCAGHNPSDRDSFLLQGSDTGAEVEFERAAGLQPCANRVAARALTATERTSCRNRRASARIARRAEKAVRRAAIVAAWQAPRVGRVR